MTVDDRGERHRRGEHPTVEDRRQQDFDASLWWKDEWRPCGCAACTALLDEYGATRYAQIFVDNGERRGWAGGFSSAERNWMKAHGSPAYQAQRARGMQASTLQEATDEICAA